MADLANEHTERLAELKNYVKDWHDYFHDNFKRYDEFMHFVFCTNLTNDDITKLQALQKPQIEFSFLEAYISRLRGEFAEQEPSLKVSAADGLPKAKMTEQLNNTIDAVESHIREIFFSATNDGLENKLYLDLLGGGFSVAKVYTDYVNELSFEQKILVERVFEPTLTGFDPLARETHKGDGRFCFEIYPMTKEEFEKRYGKDSTKGMTFARNVEGFSWSYQNNRQKIVLLCNMYLKKTKKAKIVKLSNGETILKKHYEQLIELFNAEGRIEQPPIIMEERWTTLESICQYIFCGNQVFEYNNTNYSYLPLVFLDGNSVVVKSKDSNIAKQMTKPYVYHAKGIQKLKNFSGQTVAAEIENMVQHKFKVAIESIPEDYLEAYDNVQQAQVLGYNAFYDKDPSKPLPPPMEIQRTPTPNIVQDTFLGSDRVTQAILGSYDAELGISNQPISGKAIQQGSLHSNAAAKPYYINYVNGMNRVAQIILDLIPKYYLTPRTIPIRLPNGLRSYVVINDPKDPKSISFKYSPKDLQIKLEVGVNSTLQKQLALEQIIRLMGASELFANFINSVGLETLLNNIDIRGIEDLKLKAVTYMQDLQKQKEAQAEQPNPIEKAIEAEMEIERERIEQKKEQAEGELAIKAAETSIDKQKADIEYARLLAEIEDKDRKAAMEQERISSQDAKEAVELLLNVSKGANINEQ